MLDILKEYIRAHPAMEPEDYIKFCYQSVLGPGHAAPARGNAASWINEEMRGCGRRREGDLAVTQLEGPGVRLDIDCGISSASLAGLFCRSAAEWPQASGERVISLVTNMAISQLLPFSRAELNSAVDRWRAQGYPPPGHSEKYKSNYRAHYRVVLRRFLPYLETIAAIERLRRPAVIAIDGMCGAGKSLMARLLAYLFDAALVYMDDFFLPYEMKTVERLSYPGGNIHYERFLRQVAPHLGKLEPFSYDVYDCSEGAIKGSRRVPAADITIVEGSYSMNPYISGAYDLRVFVETDQRTRRARLLAREGEKGMVNFEQRWIPLENMYFSRLRIKEQCDVIVRT